MLIRFLERLTDLFFWGFWCTGCFFAGGIFVMRDHPYRIFLTTCFCFAMAIFLANADNKMKGE